jgi:hypothetical protein
MDASSTAPAGAVDPVTGRRCLYVVGMHRSGTSAVTGLLVQLGLHGPGEEDVPAVTRWNARGNFESARLIRFNDQMLIDHGGSWGAPRPFDTGWETAPEVADRRVRAARIIGKVFGSDPFVFKDPRNCLTLPFWRTVIAPPAAAVLVYRNPLEVAGSMRARNGITMTHGLALWERYVRSSMAGLDGVPTLVVGFDRVLDDAVTWCGELTEFLGGVGIGCDVSALDRAARSLDGQLRHVHHTTPQVGGIHETQRQLLEALGERDGAHLPWAAPDVGDEPSWVEDVLTMRREFLDEHGRNESAMSTAARVRQRIGRRARDSPTGG